MQKRKKGAHEEPLVIQILTLHESNEAYNCATAILIRETLRDMGKERGGISLSKFKGSSLKYNLCYKEPAP